MAAEQPSGIDQRQPQKDTYAAAISALGKIDLAFVVGAGAGGLVLGRLELLRMQAHRRAEGVLTQYQTDSKRVMPWIFDTSEGALKMRTSVAAQDGIRYEVDKANQIPQPAITAAQGVLRKITVDNRARIINVVESELLTTFSEEITETAEDLAGESPEVLAAKKLHSTIRENTPLTDEHIKGAFGIIGKTLHLIVGPELRVLEMPARAIITAFSRSHEGLAFAVSEKLASVVRFNESNFRGGQALQDALKQLATDLEVDLTGVDINQFGTAIAALFVLDNAQTLFNRGENGEVIAPEDVRRIATIIETTGSLDYHQTTHSQTRRDAANSSVTE